MYHEVHQRAMVLREILEKLSRKTDLIKEKIQNEINNDILTILDRIIVDEGVSISDNEFEILYEQIYNGIVNKLTR